MLSRVAQASRLGLMASRLTRPVATPALRIQLQPTSLAIASSIRSYAKKSKRPRFQHPNRPENPKPDTESASKPEEQVTETEAVGKAEDKATETEPISKSEDKTTEAGKESEQIAFDKLPDLTQGIPSTLEYELKGKDKESQAALEESPEPESGGDRGGRERAEYVSTSERNRKWWTRFSLIASAAGATFTLLYFGRSFDAAEAERFPDVTHSNGPVGFWERARARWGDSVSYYQEPAFEKLLPDPDPSFERPYTLCLSLDELLIHSEWSRDHGWRIAKRPGVDYFIRYLSQYYELVLFTTVPFATGEPVVRKLDPFRFIMWPLYREATKFQEGEIVKDLSYLNRDLSKVIIIDTESKNVRNQPENAIVLKPWKGDPNDKDLVGLIPFLEYIHTMQYSDVRKVLKSFEGKHIPTEFARREAIARKEFEARRLAEKNRHHSSGVGALGNLLGLKPSNMSMMVSPEGEQSPTEAFAQGKMLQDIARERGQRNYELLEREIRENGEKWLKEEQEMMEKAQKEAMSSMMGSFSGMFGAGSSEKKP